jgi:hypothetical protein
MGMKHDRLEIILFILGGITVAIWLGAIATILLGYW